MKALATGFVLVAFALASGTAWAACPDGSVQVATGCNEAPTVGCCKAPAILQFCHENLTCSVDCTTLSQQCGWTGSLYGCGASAGVDPAGTHPRECVCTPNCQGKTCGDNGCGGSCGTCTRRGDVCQDGKCVCTPNCSGRECGDDGCGGTCGSCTNNYLWECTPEGRCKCNPDCAVRVCGKDGCGGSCGTCSGGLVCAGGRCQEEPCFPACTAKKCGPDGCDGQCGTCSAEQTCTIWGQCVECPRNCEGRECGSDGCGSTCGQCLSGQTCSDVGMCEGECQPLCDGRDCGPNGCGGACGECTGNSVCNIGNGLCEAGPCEPVCQDRECGFDGCGGVCGLCESPAQCNADGACEIPCEPTCQDRQCGDDGCGGSCGECGTALSCVEGRCRAASSGDVPGGSDSTEGPCPPGYTVYYGQCVPTGSTDNKKGGGCTTGVPMSTAILPFLALAAIWLTVRRRSHR